MSKKDLCRIAILFSGRGSNMRSLATHISRANVPAELVFTLCNRPNAEGIEFCQTNQIDCHVIDHKQYEQRQDFDEQINHLCTSHNIDLICAAGFMRLLTEKFVSDWHNRLLNIHPSLLPELKGLNTHERALQSGKEEHGCTVHYMRPAMDEGPIIIQKSVPIHLEDTEKCLSSRVLEQEHIIYPQALDIVLKNRGYY